jgi:alcohol dehydrogenase (cytochrome c)
MGLGGRTNGAVGAVGNFITAIAPLNGNVAWRHELLGGGGAPGMLTTGRPAASCWRRGGNIVAVEAATGKPLWHSRIGPVSNAPQTYMLDGHQYLLTSPAIWCLRSACTRATAFRQNRLPESVLCTPCRMTCSSSGRVRAVAG